MTVKQKKRGRPRTHEGQLSAKNIMEMAKAMMREEGKVPSIRKLASNLDVDAMAIYYYFENKSCLLEAMTTSLIEEVYQPNGEQDWKLELRLLCTSYLTLLSNYSGLLETLLNMSAESPANVFMQRFSLIIEPLKLNKIAEQNALDLLVDYLHGFALAMRCNNGESPLEFDMLDGPLALYCLGLEHVRVRDKQTQISDVTMNAHL
ncbi:TetR/AcrR family transcriptional regulator [Vibrio taketomensis]|uniref:TetR/AcrR family transcriptional regulator n=1 Tax=Vibrio taketomensis TaxID=2572923 RepID=UPI0013898736|nr:TetR/AcrR family transcriptional regulator [Vibrio taketomensis]